MPKRILPKIRPGKFLALSLSLSLAASLPVATAETQWQQLPGMQTLGIDGIFYSTATERSSVMLRDNEEYLGRFRVGDEIKNGLTIQEIAPDYVVMEGYGKQAKLGLFGINEAAPKSQVAGKPRKKPQASANQVRANALLEYRQRLMGQAEK